MPEAVEAVAASRMVRIFEALAIQADSADVVPLSALQMGEQVQGLRDRGAITYAPRNLQVFLRKRAHFGEVVLEIGEIRSSFEGSLLFWGRFWISIERTTKPLTSFRIVRVHLPEPPHVDRQLNELPSVSRLEERQRGSRVVVLNLDSA